MATRFQIEINPRIPERLQRLEELANNLWYSWDRPTRDLFVRLGGQLWAVSGHSPKATLKRLDQHNLDDAAQDHSFLGALGRVLAAYDTYHSVLPGERHPTHFSDKDLVAYFCAEFGFHESLPIYSGGLGILAGDHCKTASDMHLPFVGIGLLYRQGYFTQAIDAYGKQNADYHDADFEDLPIAEVMDAQGQPLLIEVALPGREVYAKVWQAKVGHVTLYLMDTALPQNSEHDRDITHRLYGGDRTTRIEQEILLGMGGTKILSTLGLKPTVWHINEGHAAFQIIERIREGTQAGLDFASALEAVAGNTVFTTHTVVSAGHDHFTVEMIKQYFEPLCPQLGCNINTLLALGRMPGRDDFNMTALAIHGSRFHNGVSRIHGEVSAKVFARIWPQIEANDNPIGHITNGVHFSTFLSDLWYETFSRRLGIDWPQRLTDTNFWEGINKIPDHLYWSVRQSIKGQMLYVLNSRISHQHTRNHSSRAHLELATRWIIPENPNVLTIGFARRFATYKRAALLFSDLARLKEIITNPKRPVVFVFSGKAHPADEPGKSIIQRIAEIAAMPEFNGHILLLENYDIHVARSLVSGVDVWLNNPIYPLEASGTSGMKAAINGAINLSVLDGWWGEVCNDKPGEENGWGIKPVSTSGEIDDPQRDAEEAQALFSALQYKVIPLYYERGNMGYSPGWVAVSKRSISTIAPRYNSERMLNEYISKYYVPASKQWRHLSQDNFANARLLAAWKEKVRAAWSKVSMTRIDTPIKRVDFGKEIKFEVAIQLNGLSAEDVCVDLLFSRPNASINSSPPRIYNMQQSGISEQGKSLFSVSVQPEICGKIEYSIRVYPSHALLAHKFEMGMMLWL